MNSAAPAMRRKVAHGKKFLTHIHYVRGIAILSVVAAHINVEWPVGSTLHKFFQVIWENSTLLYMFMTGYLFQHLMGKFEYKTYLVKRTKYVILPYLLLSIPILFYRLKTGDVPELTLQLFPDFKTWPVARQVGFYLLRGAHMHQFWFIPMFFLYYLISPLFHYIDRHPRLYWLILPAIVLSIIVERDPMIEIPRMFAHFFSVYLFGMFISRYQRLYMRFARKNWHWLTGLTIAAIVLNFIYFDAGNKALNYLHKMLLCCSLLYWMWKLERYMPRFMVTFANYSIGIYFLHYYVIVILRALYVKWAGHPPAGNLFSWALSLSLVLVCTVVCIKLVKRVSGKYSKLLIGC